MLNRIMSVFAFVMVATFVSGIATSETASAATAAEINAGTDKALANFREKVSGGESLLQKADGVLVFPSVYKAGFVFGGEYGEGALRIHGKTVEYYSTAAASWGLQIGAQKKTLIILFMDKGALTEFRNSRGWTAGVDGSIAVVNVGAGESVNTNTVGNPIMAFVLDSKGLMANLTLEGSKYTKIVR